MKIVKAIATPWCPHSVIFSRDGSRLVIGGGNWYGNGGIAVHRLQDGAHEYLQWRHVLPETARFAETWATRIEGLDTLGVFPSVSGLSLSDDDRFLAASMWDARHSYAPTRIFTVDELTLRPHHTFAPPSSRFSWTPTGVLIHGDRVITRFHRSWVSVLSDSLSCAPTPYPPGTWAAGGVDYLTHSRVIVKDRYAVTGLAPAWFSRAHCDNSGEPPDYPGYPTNEEVYLRGGLSVRSLDDPSDGLFTPVPGVAEVSAIAVLPDGDFVTGGSDGEVDRWDDVASWPKERLRQGTRTSGDRRLGIVEDPSATIMGLASTIETHRLVAVNAGGDLLVDVGTPREISWKIPIAGRPRSIAAHPQKQLIAVGMKQGGWAQPASVVALIDLA